MKSKILLLTLALVISPASFAKKPRINCNKQVGAMREARKMLYLCLDEWAKDMKADDPDPNDDCKAKLDAYLKSSQEIKICKGGGPKPEPIPTVTPVTTPSPSPSSN